MTFSMSTDLPVAHSLLIHKQKKISTVDRPPGAGIFSRGSFVSFDDFPVVREAALGADCITASSQRRDWLPEALALGAPAVWPDASRVLPAMF